MKIRNGFVSNSSSTSFCIYGMYIEDSNDLGELNEIEKLIHKVGLEIYYSYEDICVFIGKSWSSIKDEQTGKQFKDEIEEKLKKTFPDLFKNFVIQLETYDECFYDG